jgi:hypothetical protein
VQKGLEGRAGEGVDALEDVAEPALDSFRHLDERVHIGEQLGAVSDIVHGTGPLREPTLGGRVAAFDPLVERVLEDSQREEGRRVTWRLLISSIERRIRRMVSRG